MDELLDGSALEVITDPFTVTVPLCKSRTELFVLLPLELKVPLSVKFPETFRLLIVEIRVMVEFPLADG